MLFRSYRVFYFLECNLLNPMNELAIAAITIATYQVSKYIGYSEYPSVGAAIFMNFASRIFASTQEMKPKNYHPGLFGENNGFVMLENKDPILSGLKFQ